MVKKQRVLGEVVDFCRFPVPRSRSEIAQQIINLRYYSSSPDRVIEFISPLLDEACRRGLLVEYSPKSTDWSEARQLVTEFAKRRRQPVPRKLNRLYQTNFFCLSESFGLAEFPVLRQTNVALTALFYPFVRNKKASAFFWNLLNLFLAYQSWRDRLRIRVYGLNLTENEREALLKALEQYPSLESLLVQLPFLPNVEKAEEFLEKLAE